MLVVLISEVLVVLISEVLVALKVELICCMNEIEEKVGFSSFLK